MSAELREGYKQTEVGMVPEDWKIEQIGDLAHVTTGSRNTQDRINDGMYPFFVRSQTIERINSYSFDGEAILTAGDGVGTGKVFHYINGKFDVHQRVYKISDFNQNINGKFLFLYFSANFFDRVMQMTAKSSVDSVRMEMITQMLVPMPPLHEQRAIASALADVDALLASLDDLLTKKRQLKQAAMQELLTGKTRLDGFTGEWESTALKDLAERFIVPMRDKPIFGGDIPWCRIEDFSGKYLTRSKSRQKVSKETIEKMNLKIMPVDTLLISCSADLGRCAIVGAPLITNQTFIGLVPNKSKSNVEFLYYLVGSRAEELNNLSSGTTISYLSREHFENFAVFLPLDVAEQKAIASILSEMDAELDALAERVTKTRQLKQGMMQELLTGRTRLI